VDVLRKRHSRHSRTSLQKLFVIPIKNVSEAEAEMNVFLRGHRVLAVQKEFVTPRSLSDFESA